MSQFTNRPSTNPLAILPNRLTQSSTIGPLIYLSIDSIIRLLLADSSPSINLPLKKVKNNLFSLDSPKIKIHLSLRPFSFSLHLILVNSCENKNKETMTYPHSVSYFPFYLIYYILYLLPLFN